MASIDLTGAKLEAIEMRMELKKLTREELRDRSVKGLCRHYDKPWSCDHYCKKGRLPMIESIEESEEEDLEPEEENAKENL
ncbi:hypothetical protein BHE74_00006123 [Ensete ventricosum]|nr:hypothetical protein BHE74_00006123 [Ensete ventricosum]